MQCSKLETFLFDVYSSDFVNIYMECTLYAGDFALVFVGNNLEELVQRVNGTLQEMKSWCNGNKLQFNETKKEWMLIYHQ